MKIDPLKAIEQQLHRHHTDAGQEPNA